MHSTQFNYHFIKSILKSHDFMALNFRFWCIVPSRAGLLEIPESEMLLFSMQKMSCDENLFKHNKQGVLSIMTNWLVRDQWEYLKEMEWHFPIKSGKPTEMAVVILNSFTEFPN